MFSIAENTYNIALQEGTAHLMKLLTQLSLQENYVKISMNV